MTTSSTLTASSLKRSLDLIEIKPGVKFSLATLRDLLPDTETVLFFGKVYELDAQQLGTLLAKVLNSDLATALFLQGGSHSSDLQDYLVEGWYGDDGSWHDPLSASLLMEAGEITFDPEIPKGEILPDVWKSLEVDIADSIKDVASKLESVINLLPGKKGSMVFGAMMKMNARRPTLGDYKAGIYHAPQAQNLVILDVSGSMSSNTIHTIVEDVVALSYAANAHMAVVSNSCTYWEPGTYTADDILQAAEFGGTHYEQLLPLFSGQDWGVVITIADYDSSRSAKDHLRYHATGRVEQVLDISLVDRPTFLAECVGQMANEVRPLLIAAEHRNFC